MLDAIQDLRSKLHDADGSSSRIAVELNTSCPNIKDTPPPAYDIPSLVPLLNVLSEHYWKDPTLTMGLKLPPYFYSTQFEDVVRCISGFSNLSRNPFAFLTCTNTVGSCLFFSDQAEHETPTNASQFALPTAFGGLAGESIHALSLGNVHTFVELLASAKDKTLCDIKIFGVGGVTSPAGVTRMRKAGASVVGCATLLGKMGCSAFERLSDIQGHD
jgi:dihydroorotate dehydrogenase (fumarate)